MVGHRDRFRSSEIQREEEQLVFHTERSLWTWSDLWSGCFLEEVKAPPTGIRPQHRPRKLRRDYIFHLFWECLGIAQEELVKVAQEKGMWVTLLSLLKPQPMDGRLEISFKFVLLYHICQRCCTFYVIRLHLFLSPGSFKSHSISCKHDLKTWTLRSFGGGQ